MRERGAKSPYAYIEHYIGDHGHMVPMGNAQAGIVLDMEEGCTLLADAILACSPDKHNGHGQTHTQEDAERGFRAGLHQLLTRNFDQEWIDLQMKITAFKRWGGHPPKGVLMPSEDDKKKWSLLVTTQQGDPYMYDVKPSVGRDFSDIIPPPDDSNSVKAPLGWYTKRRWSADRRLKHLARKGL